MVEQSHICVDDFGTAMYRCRHTGVIVPAYDAIAIGATIPGVRARYFIAPTQSARRAMKESGVAFYDADANCNTCAHLIRVGHRKDPAGFLYGRCGSDTGRPADSPYADRHVGGVMVFHPDDPMHMPCYASRWGATRRAKEIARDEPRIDLGRYAGTYGGTVYPDPD